jgi:hypothetical protein
VVRLVFVIICPRSTPSSEHRGSAANKTRAPLSVIIHDRPSSPASSVSPVEKTTERRLKNFDFLNKTSAVFNRGRFELARARTCRMHKVLAHTTPRAVYIVAWCKGLSHSERIPNLAIFFGAERIDSSSPP